MDVPGVSIESMYLQKRYQVENLKNGKFRVPQNRPKSAQIVVYLVTKTILSDFWQNSAIFENGFSKLCIFRLNCM